MPFSNGYKFGQEKKNWAKERGTSNCRKIMWIELLKTCGQEQNDSLNRRAKSHFKISVTEKLTLVSAFKL